MPAPIVLPPLVWKDSPNHSSRHGSPIELVVLHETAGSYAGAVSWLCNPAADASAHFVLREDGGEATQIVRMADKAWTQGAFNPRCLSIELATIRPQGFATARQLAVAARIAGWLLLQHRLPPRWARRGSGRGVCFHGELGALGANHPYCGPNVWGWHYFLERLEAEVARGDYRKEWAYR